MAMMTRFTHALLAGLFWAALVAGVAAQDIEKDTENASEELQGVEQELDAATGRKDELEKAVEDLARETEEFSRKLVATASRVQASEAEIAATTNSLSYSPGCSSSKRTRRRRSRSTRRTPSLPCVAPCSWDRWCPNCALRPVNWCSNCPV